jgi:hypothetical protein
LRTGIELLAKALYQIPALLGQGEWWVLSDEEARTISTQGEAALSSMDSKRLDKATKFFNSFAPWVALVVTVITVTYIRVQITSMAYAKARGLRGSTPGTGSENPAATGNGGVPGGGAAAGTGPTRDRVAERLGGTE